MEIKENTIKDKNTFMGNHPRIHIGTWIRAKLLNFPSRKETSIRKCEICYHLRVTRYLEETWYCYNCWMNSQYALRGNAK